MSSSYTAYNYKHIGQLSYVFYILKKCFKTSSNFKTYLFAYLCDFFEVQLICNVVLVSRLQQSDSVTHTHVFFIRFFSIIGYYAFKKKWSRVDLWGFPRGSDGKESPCNTGNPGSIPGLGRSPGGERGNALQHSLLENPMDRGARWGAVHRVTQGQA